MRIPVQTAFTGVLAALVGFASSFAVVLQGLGAVGATPGQAASGLMAVSIGMGLCSLILSLVYRMPIAAAWSTPGAALLAASAMPEGGFAAAVGAFLVSSLLLICAGLWKPLGRMVSAIPAAIANAMLAGVLLGLCLAPVKAIAFDPWLGLPILLAWIIAGRIHKLAAVPAALIAFVIVTVIGVDHVGAVAFTWRSLLPQLEFVVPRFEVASLLGLALPLFLVTMASQNIPGIAVLQVNGYQPKPGPLFAATGLASLLTAPFGAHATNLAAITAAMCAGPDAHADPSRRWIAAAVNGGFYVLFGLLAGGVTALVALAPVILIQAVAGLALIGSFAGSAMAAFQDLERREAAAVTFLVTASGLSFHGISGAFWGLLAGVAMLGLKRIGSRPKA